MICLGWNLPEGLFLRTHTRSEYTEMQHLRVEERSRGCRFRCLCAPFLGLAESGNSKNSNTAIPTTSKVSRLNFVTATSASLFPNTYFTNHESLPSMEDAFASFLAVYPQYTETEYAKQIRESEYNHLSDHICLDYAGFGLFSHSQVHSSIASSSSSPSPYSSSHLLPPSFSLSYESASLKSQVLHRHRESDLEFAMRKRIMSFINISSEDYDMVYTANRTSAFKLLAESYPFQSNKRLLTVYDYESEAVNAMEESTLKRDGQVMSASFSWPSLRINSTKLKKMVINKRKKDRGLFVFPLQSRITGARYSYLWMNLAQENGWHVVLDVCALGPKDMDTLGLSLFKPDFLICSFFKVLGENPSGFACLFVKKSSRAALENSTVARSIGIVSIIPANLSSLTYNSGTDSDSQIGKSQPLEDDDTTRSFSGPISAQAFESAQVGQAPDLRTSLKLKQVYEFYQGETSEPHEQELNGKQMEQPSSESVELQGSIYVEQKVTKKKFQREIECRSLDHADSLGLLLITCRQRYIINWLVIALTKLKHPHTNNIHSLVRIYGPKVKFDRGPTIAFNVFDWKGEKIEPELVQKLADRSNISLSYSFLHNICFSEKYERDRDRVLEKRINEEEKKTYRREKNDFGIGVVTVSLSFLAGFEDAYKLWAFVVKFLDADFVEKERWRYTALNQKMVEV